MREGKRECECESEIERERMTGGRKRAKRRPFPSRECCFILGSSTQGVGGIKEREGGDNPH